MQAEWIDDLRRAYDAKADERDARTIEPWKSEERERFLSVLLAEGKTRLLLRRADGTSRHQPGK